MRARIEIWSLNNQQQYYSYNPFTATGTSGQPESLTVSRSFQHHGQATLKFEDKGRVLDKTKIRTPSRLKVWLSKEDANWVPYYHGFLRATMPSMHIGPESNHLELVSGGIGQRANERILDFDRTTPSVLDDGVTLDINDVQQQADEMIRDSINDENEYPADTIEDNVEGGSGLGYIDSSHVKDLGTLKDYLHSIVARFVTMQDFWNMIENYTGGRVYVDFDAAAQFTPLPTPVSVNKGFLLTRKANPLTDSSDTTCQIVGGSYKQLDSFLVDQGYANKQYGILAADFPPDNDNIVDDDGSTSSLANEIATLIKPPTNPNWELWVGVTLDDGTDADRHVQRSRWRFVRNDPLTNTIVNTNGTIFSFYGYEQDYNITDGGMQWVRIAVDRGQLDSEVPVWLVLSSVNASSTTGFWRWNFDNAFGGFSALAANGATSDTNGGTGWTYSTGNNYVVRMIRHKDQAFSCSFNGGIRSRSLIEQGIGNFPQQVDTPLAGIKYMLGLGRMRSSPQRTYPNIIIRPPNMPVFEGDVFQLKIPEQSVGCAGRPAEVAQISDVSYAFGGEVGAQEASLGAKFLDITLRTYPQGY